MKRFILAIGLLFCPLFLYAQPTASTLAFQTNVPVAHRVITLMELHQHLPGLEFKTGLEQTLDMETSLLGGGDLIEEIQAPLTIQVTIKRIQLHTRGNGETLVFDSQEALSDAHMSQLNHIINQPILIYLNSAYQIEGPIEDLLILSKDFPSLSLLFSERFFSELFSSLFALAGKELSTGKHVPAQLGLGELCPTAIPANYEVSAINFKEVEANIRGKIEDLDIRIPPGFSVRNPHAQGAEEIHYTMTGYVSGKARWERRHAMIHSVRLQHTYNAQFQLGRLSWPMTLTITHQMESHRITPRMYTNDARK